MKKEMVIITDLYYPKTSATAALALNCVDYLDDEYNIRIIAVQEGNYKASGMKIGGAFLYTLSQWRLKWAQLAEERARISKGVVCLINRCSYFLARCVGRVQSLFFVLDNRWWYQRKAYSTLKKLEKEKHIDSILSVSIPIEAHIAAEKYKKQHSEIWWVSYWGDLFACDNCKLNIFISLSSMKRLERRLIHNSDAVLTTEEIVDILKQRVMAEDVKKVKSVPYVMKQSILDDGFVSSTPMGDIVNCVYMGSLYKDIRNPEYMLKLFASEKNTRFILDLYTEGNCDNIVHKYVNKSEGKIAEHGLVSPKKLLNILKNAHVLINIDNTISTSNPSKLLELMSYKKPILDFCYNDREGIIDQYPLAIKIKKDTDFDEALKKMNFLIDSDIATKVDAKYMMDKFGNYTEKNVSCIIKSSVKCG